MYYHFKIHKESDGYWAECVELEGCVTQGDSFDELQTNMEEALNLYLDEPDNLDVTFPLPDKIVKGEKIIEVSVHPKIGFALKMRLLRKQKGLAIRLKKDVVFTFIKILTAYCNFETIRSQIIF